MGFKGDGCVGMFGSGWFCRFMIHGKAHLNCLHGCHASGSFSEIFDTSSHRPLIFVVLVSLRSRSSEISWRTRMGTGMVWWLGGWGGWVCEEKVCGRRQEAASKSMTFNVGKPLSICDMST